MERKHIAPTADPNGDVPEICDVILCRLNFNGEGVGLR